MNPVSALLLAGVAQGSPILVTVDTTKAVGKISPYIYGTNESDWSGRSKYLTLGRQGGNRMTAYNWENNASNAGSDWQHQNDDYLGGGNTPGEVPRAAVAAALAKNKAFLVTIPMTDYVAADKNGGGDVAQTPNYLQTRFRQNRPKKGAAFAYPPNLGDGFVYQDEFVGWLERQFLNRKSPIWYSLDNEPDLWFDTHARIHPNQVTYAEILQRTISMASAIKDVAPGTLVFGPVSYGFNGYVNLQNASDNGGRDFLNWYMASLRAHAQTNGRRLVDVLDLHWYPEARGGGVRVIGSETGAATVQARIQAPRSLWDPTYVEDSWIARDWYGNQPVRMISRLKQQIAANDPQMRLAFTEYSYGGSDHISGAIAQADVLGIFGREGVFAATYWPFEGNSTYVHAAFDAYRNYDGRAASFGDVSLPTTTSNVAEVTAYSSKFSTGQFGTVSVVINKASASRNAELWLRGAKFTTVTTYSLTSATPAMRPSSIGRKSGDRVVLTLPAMSVNVVVAR